LNLLVQEEVAAKKTWRDEEGRQAVEKAVIDLDNANVAMAMKKVNSLEDLVELRKALLGVERRRRAQSRCCFPSLIVMDAL
jgi:hypothetical protein